MRYVKLICWGLSFFGCLLAFMGLGILLPCVWGGLVHDLEPLPVRVVAGAVVIFAASGVLQAGGAAGKRLTQMMEES